ncbi:MAG: PhoH family protein [Chitinivibrionales bacterium]|nr:PhoH family protein [Chitinivibrionales bacterium]
MKNFIIDTTILLYDPAALFAFGNNSLFVPIHAVEEIDKFKRDMNEIGRSARQVSRILDSLRSKGSLASGVTLDNGGTLSVIMAKKNHLEAIQKEIISKDHDRLLFAVALELQERGQQPPIIVTKDVNLRIKADSLGIGVQDYESERVAIEELYSGYRDCIVEKKTIDELRSFQPVTLDAALMPNQYVCLIDAADESNRVLGCFNHAKGMVYPLVQNTKQISCRISTKNPQQAFALDALLNDSIELVTLVGKAGTGKTLLAIAASVFKTVDENIYNRILISRPTLPFSQDIGYLPGSVEDKLMPWMYPIADNVELIMRKENHTGHKIRGFRELVSMGILIIEPLTYIRGRSIHNQFLIVDEAQNLTPHEIKTVITRVGEGTKIVLTGDPYQIDNPYIDASSNGLTCVVEKFKNERITAHVTLTKGERSPLSELAANIL